MGEEHTHLEHSPDQILREIVKLEQVTAKHGRTLVADLKGRSILAHSWRASLLMMNSQGSPIRLSTSCSSLMEAATSSAGAVRGCRGAGSSLFGSSAGRRSIRADFIPSNSAPGFACRPSDTKVEASRDRQLIMREQI
ncbi:MAG: hypothetical protein FRX49_03692 [Trebouxia sp. A1-2]|nr:MAG: hypothetical protein FRX49_03692 [Trebouxia sp. A1-2]